MAVRQRVIALLRGHEASRIRFRFPSGGGTIAVGPQHFRRVAHAIECGQVLVTPTHNFRAGVAAQYVQPNAIQTPPVIHRTDEGAVLHESLHAAYDLLRTPINARDEEASAYIVSALYMRMAGLNVNQWTGTAIFARANDLATLLLRQYQRGDVAVPTIDATAWLFLRAAVVLDPVYFWANGRAGDYTLGPAVTGGSYPHDG